jgi:hypothetical protein
VGVFVLQESFSCVTYQRLNFSGGNYKSPDPLLLILGDGSPVPLPGPARVSHTFQMHYVIIPGEGIRGPWQTSTHGYLYGLDDD